MLELVVGVASAHCPELAHFADLFVLSVLPMEWERKKKRTRTRSIFFRLVHCQIVGLM